MRGGVPLALALAAVAFAVRRRPAYIADNTRGGHRIRRRQRMAQRFTAHGFAAAERLERELFFTERQRPLEIEQSRWAQRAAAAEQFAEGMRGRLPAALFRRVLVVVCGVAGAVLLFLAGDVVRDSLRALDVERPTATLTSAVAAVLLLCLGAILGEATTADLVTVLRIPPGARALAALVLVGLTAAIVHISPASADARFEAPVVEAGAACQTSADVAPLANPGCVEHERLSAEWAQAQRAERLRAATLPAAAAVGAAALARLIYLLATFAAGLRARRLRRYPAAINRRIQRERAQYQADVATAAEQAGVDPQTIVQAA